MRTRLRPSLLLAASLPALTISPALAQSCVLANPSFEVGSGLDGWNAFGDVAVTTTNPAHGSRAVSIGGPNSGDWAISAVWQPRPASPGSSFTAAVHVSHDAATPLTDDARAILNIEWRDAADNLISYETHTLLTPADPTGTDFARRVTSAPAPAGTASVRLLLAVLQSPAQETGRATYDLAEFLEQTTPTYDESQWGDFPGGRVIEFAGRRWRVKGDGFFGPGPNWFDDDPATVLVANSDLRLAVSGSPGNWSSAEVVLEDPLGYGDYITTTRGRLDTLAPNAVLGIFLWQYPQCYEDANTWNQHNEIDVEISRWGNPADVPAQFVVQPYNVPGNLNRFDIDYAAHEAADEPVSYAFRWLPDRVEFRCWSGGPSDESPTTILNAWTYTGPHLPRPEQPRLHLNLWTFNGGPSTGQPQAALIDDFRFVPLAPPCPADLNLDGVLDNGDIQTFVLLFLAGDLAADLNADSVLDNGDIQAFVATFLTGC